MIRKYRKKTPRQKQILRLDDLFRDYIRKRDKRCQRCRKTRFLQVAHIITRSNLHTRWLPDNAALLCGGCHMFWAHKEPLEFTEWVQKRLGARKYILLLRAKRDMSKLDLDLVEEGLKVLVNEI